MHRIPNQDGVIPTDTPADDHCLSCNRATRLRNATPGGVGWSPSALQVDGNLENAIGNTRTDECDQGRASTEKGHLPKSIPFPVPSPTITMPDPTLLIPVPSEDPKPKNKQESESNETKQKQNGEKEQEDLVCLPSVLRRMSKS